MQPQQTVPPTDLSALSCRDAHVRAAVWVCRPLVCPDARNGAATNLAATHAAAAHNGVAAAANAVAAADSSFEYCSRSDWPTDAEQSCCMRGVCCVASDALVDCPCVFSALSVCPAVILLI